MSRDSSLAMLSASSSALATDTLSALLACLALGSTQKETSSFSRPPQRLRCGPPLSWWALVASLSCWRSAWITLSFSSSRSLQVCTVSVSSTDAILFRFSNSTSTKHGTQPSSKGGQQVPKEAGEIRGSLFTSVEIRGKRASSPSPMCHNRATPLKHKRSVTIVTVP